MDMQSLNFIVNKILFWALIFMLFLELYNILFHLGTPNIRTAPAIRKRMIEILKEDFEAKKDKPYTIVDLGSGNGALTREIAKTFPQAKVVGVEIAKTSVLWSNWLKRKLGLNNLSYEKMNVFSYDLSKADAIVMYLLPSMLDSLGKKMHKELKPGTLIISNKFRLGDGWEPENSESVKTLYFHQRDLHIYRNK